MPKEGDKPLRAHGRSRIRAFLVLDLGSQAFQVHASSAAMHLISSPTRTIANNPRNLYIDRVSHHVMYGILYQNFALECLSIYVLQATLHFPSMRAELHLLFRCS